MKIRATVPVLCCVGGDGQAVVQRSEQPLEALRQIASRVDTLIETINAVPQPGTGVHAAVPADASVGGRVLPHVRRLMEALEPAALMEAIVDAAAELTGAQRVFLMLVEEGNKLRFKSGRGIDQQALAESAFSASRGLIKRVLQEGQPVLLVGQDLAAHGLTSLAGLACAPIRLGRREGAERVGGAIYADWPAGAATPPDAAARDGLALLLEHAGVALENAQLLTQTEVARQQVLRLKDNIKRLYEVGRSINSTLILQELLVHVVDHVVEISRAQRGCVMLLEGPPEDRRLVFRVGRDARRRDVPENLFAYSTTVTSRALDEKRSIVMTEAVGVDLSVSMERLELQSIMCVPLSEKAEPFGVLYMDSQQSNREFDDSDREIVESLSGQASVAIINAKLYEEAGERERLAHELDIAARLQRDMLPTRIPEATNLEMFGLLTPAAEVGGDYYDFIPHEGTSDALTIAIGDVSGKGVGAGLVMAMARSTLHSLVFNYGNPGSPLPIMRSLNVMLCRGIPAGMFMTLNILIWDGAARRFFYTPAGHEHLLVYRGATGEVEAIKAGGVAAGVLESANAHLAERSLDVAPGDQVLLYTDGVTEAMNEAHEGFGLDQTVALVREHGRLSPRELCEAIHAAIVSHRGAARPHDDITLVALRVT